MRTTIALLASTLFPAMLTNTDSATIFAPALLPTVWTFIFIYALHFIIIYNIIKIIFLVYIPLNIAKNLFASGSYDFEDFSFQLD
jgi:hypothetical protein